MHTCIRRRRKKWREGEWERKRKMEEDFTHITIQASKWHNAEVNTVIISLLRSSIEEFNFRRAIWESWTSHSSVKALIRTVVKFIKTESKLKWITVYNNSCIKMWKECLQLFARLTDLFTFHMRHVMNQIGKRHTRVHGLRWQLCQRWVALVCLGFGGLGVEGRRRTHRDLRNTPVKFVSASRREHRMGAKQNTWRNSNRNWQHLNGLNPGI